METKERKAFSNSLKFDKVIVFIALIPILVLTITAEAPGFTAFIIIFFIGFLYQLYKLHKHLTYDDECMYIKLRNGEKAIPLTDITDISVSYSIWFRSLWRIEFKLDGQSYYCYTYPKFYFITIRAFIKQVKIKNPNVDFSYIRIG